MRLAGYASIFDAPDAGGDVVRRGAFAGARPVPLLWQHASDEPIGFVESLTEDARGLRVVARIADTRRGGDAATLLRAGALDGLSFGYRVRASRPGRGFRELTALDLLEISLVTFPMQRAARVIAFAETQGETA